MVEHMEDKELITGIEQNLRTHLDGLWKEVGAINNKIEEAEKQLAELKEQKERKVKNLEILREGVEGARKAYQAASRSQFLKQYPEFG
jgi:predicted  nucleic acid-binding Zn-ribbon protein